MNMIDKEHLAVMQKREETIEKVYKEKAHYLDEVETKEDAFREGINAAMQVLNLHLVSESLIDLKQLVADKTLELLDLTANNQYTHDLKKQIEFAINSINAIK